jgi:hypothetical protein
MNECANQSVYNYVPQTNHSAAAAAAVLWLPFVVFVLLLSIPKFRALTLVLQ